MYLTLYANKKGEVLEHSDVMMLGRSGNEWLMPEEAEMIPLPKGASLVALPGCLPVGLGYDDKPFCIEKDPEYKEEVTAVAALFASGFYPHFVTGFCKKRPE